MTAALALLLGALMAGWLAPALLGKADLTRLDPLAVLTAWLLAAAGVLAATVAGIVLLLFPGHGNGASMASAIHGCLEAISHGTSPHTEEFAGLLGALLVVVLMTRFVVMGVLVARRRARTRREHFDVLRVAARCDDNSPATWWLDHAEPLAFSLAHGRGVIVATEGLVRRLPAPEVRAVLAHEQAHLRRRHHALRRARSRWRGTASISGWPGSKREDCRPGGFAACCRAGVRPRPPPHSPCSPVPPCC